MKLELTETEHDLLVTLLQERQRELLHEISKAEIHDFRRSLQDRERVLESLLQKLAQPVVDAAA
jgi:vacuolar-type H+-ATPase subunit E/Vma4